MYGICVMCVCMCVCNWCLPHPKEGGSWGVVGVVNTNSEKSVPSCIYYINAIEGTFENVLPRAEAVRASACFLCPRGLDAFWREW